MLGTGVPRRCNLQAGIAEEAMDDLAECLAGSIIVKKGLVARCRRGIRHASGGIVAQRQVTRERDITPRLLRH